MVAGDRVVGRKPSVRAESENQALIEVPHGHLIDRALGLLPERHQVLATPPQGSATAPVQGDAGLPYLGRALHYMRWGPAEMMERYRRYGPVSLNTSLGVDRVLVAGPDAIDEVLGLGAAISGRAGTTSSARSSAADCCCWNSTNTNSTAGSCSRPSPEIGWRRISRR